MSSNRIRRIAVMATATVGLAVGVPLPARALDSVCTVWRSDTVSSGNSTTLTETCVVWAQEYEFFEIPWEPSGWTQQSHPNRPDPKTPRDSQQQKLEHCRAVRDLLEEYRKSLAAAEGAYPAAVAEAEALRIQATGLYAQVVQAREELVSYGTTSRTALEEYRAAAEDPSSVTDPVWEIRAGRGYVANVNLFAEGGRTLAESFRRDREAEAAYRALFDEWARTVDPAAAQAESRLAGLESLIHDARGIIPLLEADAENSAC